MERCNPLVQAGKPSHLPVGTFSSMYRYISSLFYHHQSAGVRGIVVWYCGAASSRCPLRRGRRLTVAVWVR